MSKTVNETIVAQGGMRVPSNSAASLTATSDASGNIVWKPLVFASSTQPAPPTGSGEWIWFQTDGNGNVTGLFSGKS